MIGDRSESGFLLDVVYGPESVPGFDPARSLGVPGEYPFTRGVYPTMYRGHPWTIREYAGFGTAAESNERYRELIAAGQTGLSVAFDLPTQMGYDSDHPLACGEVGRVGVAIDSLDDMRVLFAGIALDKVSTSMTINAPAAMLLLLYQIVAEEQGIDAQELAGTIQNDVLKEYIARGTYIFPPRPSLRFATDIFSYCREEMPRWNTISISGYHLAEAGATPVQELAFTLANAIEYVRCALGAGLAVDDFAPRLSFFFVARTTLLEEVAKFRAARAPVGPDHARPVRSPRSAVDAAQVPHPDGGRAAHGSTAGGQPGPGDRRCSGCSARRNAVVAHQFLRRGHRTADGQGGASGRSDSTSACSRDRCGGDRRPARRFVCRSNVSPTRSRRRSSRSWPRWRSSAGRRPPSRAGFQKAEIEMSAYRYAREIAAGDRTVVGVNAFTIEETETYPPLQIDPGAEQDQIESVKLRRERRDANAVRGALEPVADAASGSANVLYPLKRALVAGATLGELCDVLRQQWGTYEATDVA